MDNTGRFFLGGALGAALGYLLSRKNLDKTQRTDQEPVPATRPPVTPEAETTEPTWVIPPAPLVPSAGPEIVVTKQFLDEPVSGTGWTPSAPSAVEEDTAENEIPDAPVIEIPPVTSEEQTLETTAEHAPSVTGAEALAEAADVVDKIRTTEAPPAEETSRVDDLKSRIEETRRRIRRELEQPFETPSLDSSVEHDWTTAPVVPTAETVEVVPPAPVAAEVDETVVVEPTVAEPPKVDETVTVESAALDTFEVVIPPKPLPVEPPVAEPPFTEPVEIEPEAEEEPVEVEPEVEAEPEPEVEPEPEAEEAEVEPEVEPEPEPEIEPQPDEEVAEPAAEGPAVDEAGFTAETIPVDLDTTEPDADITAEPDLEQLPAEPELERPAEPVDYDSMRSRIESTRSRLKAKAFDAMMTGESALLGRDGDEDLERLREVSGVDDEIDKTVETSLREEEE